MGSDNSSLLPTLLVLMALKITFFCVCENEMHIYSLSNTVNKSIQVSKHCTETKNINSFSLVLQNCARVRFGALISSHLEKTTSQFFTCPCSLNLVLLNGKPFTVDLQDSFLLPSKLFSNSHYCTVLRLLQEYCIACYSVPCEKFRRRPTMPTPPTITVIKVLTIKLFLSLLNWKYPASLNSGLLKGMQYSIGRCCTAVQFTYHSVSRV